MRRPEPTRDRDDTDEWVAARTHEPPSPTPTRPSPRRPRIDSEVSLARLPWPAPDWLADPVNG